MLFQTSKYKLLYALTNNILGIVNLERDYYTYLSC